VTVEIAVAWIEGDETVLCVSGRVDEWAGVVANSRYPGALDHARCHISNGLEGVLLCGPDCDGNRD
jgi:hypothetical protein